VELCHRCFWLYAVADKILGRGGASERDVELEWGETASETNKTVVGPKIDRGAVKRRIFE